MIYSSIYANDDISKYPAAIQRAITYLKEHDFTKSEPGTYPIEGDQMYIKIFDNTSKPVENSHPEIHELYIDVQFFVTGGELMGVAPRKKEYEIVDKIEAEDVYFLGEIEGEQFIKAVPGDYIILFPNDIHRPGICDGKPETYRKCVLKVAMAIL
ncbi:MAG: YhcH/YjgK/YiaL family protein [Eubacteriales bacterium]|nr:YhcH/YjgK/YiaL family protein [Eubacteriales bacterium]